MYQVYLKLFPYTCSKDVQWNGKTEIGIKAAVWNMLKKKKGKQLHD